MRTVEEDLLFQKVECHDPGCVVYCPRVVATAGRDRAPESIVKRAAFLRGTDTVLRYSARGNYQVLGGVDRANRGGC
jgi:hypothetical protein